MNHRCRLFVTIFAAVLAGCGGSSQSDESGSDVNANTLTPVTESRDGRNYRQAITSSIGDTVVVQVFEPKRLEVGQTYPLVLHSHGYGGSRLTAPDTFSQRLIDAGYYVISIDERGDGESSGTVRVMSPDFEGQDLVAVLDWAENLEGLRRGADGEMVVGSYGGSYGGMYQFLLMGADPKHRLHVIAPDITPHDLTYSLNSGNVIKSGYALALIAGGEAIPRAAGPRQDATIFETLVNGSVTNNFPEGALNFFRYHSVAYFCDGQPAGPQSFLLGTPDPLRVPPRPFPRADVLLTQGFRDTLFNFNDGYANYECLSKLGGDVRLLTHQSGHILPVSLTSVPLPPDSTLEDALDPFYAAVTFPNFQDAGGSRACGTRTLNDVQFAWMEEKLQNRRGALDAALPTGRDFCMSLAENDAISTHSVKLGGAEFAIDDSTPQLNSVLGVGGALLGNTAREALLATQSLYTVPAGGAILAGIPMMDLVFASASGLEQSTCALPVLPLGCDPILFLAVGSRKAGATRWDIIDDQLTPVRGFGAHQGRMSGIAERLNEGDEIGLLIYGFHAQYPVTWSRDLLLPALNVSGTLQLPLLAPSDIARQGV